MTSESGQTKKLTVKKQQLNFKILPFIRVTCLIITLIFVGSLLAGCETDGRDVDDMTYVVAIGMDKGTTNALRLTLQYVVPLAIGGGGGSSGGGGGQSKSLSSITLECPSLLSGINLANHFVGKQINLQHAKVIVFSEELAKQGRMGGYIHGIIKSTQFRPGIVIAVSRKSAKDYLDSINPIQEADPARFYELIFSSYKYTGFTADTSLYNYYSAAVSDSQQPVATLVGVGDDVTPEDFVKDQSTYMEKGHDKPMAGDYKAGDIPKIGDVRGEEMGLAVFDGEKLVGELDGSQATYYLMATGKYEYSTYTIPDPLAKEWAVLVYVKISRNPVINVHMVNGKPVISLKLTYEGDFQAIQSGINYEDDGKRELFEKAVEAYLKKGILQFLDTTKELKSDICGFGRYEKTKFLTLDKWEKFGWLDKYQNASFDVSIDFKIRRPGLTIRTSPYSGSANTQGEVEQK